MGLLIAVGNSLAAEHSYMWHPEQGCPGPGVMAKHAPPGKTPCSSAVCQPAEADAASKIHLAGDFSDLVEVYLQEVHQPCSIGRT